MANYERFLNRVEKKYGGKIADLFGVKELPTNLTIGRVPGNAVAVTQGQNITFGKQYLRDASKSDIRGAMIHELTHAYEVGHGKSDQRIETLADFARYKLNKNDPGWDPSREVLAMAGRGNKVGDGNRMRNTQQNKLSKNPGGAKALPAMSPAQNAAHYAQMQALFAQYQNQLMQLKQERVGLRTGFRQARTDIRGELIGGLSDVQNSNIERGTYGGSAGYQQEIGVRAEADQARAAAKTEMLQGLAYNQIAKQGAATDYQMGLAQLQAEKLAQQQEMLAAQLERNAIISGFESLANATTDSNKGNGGGAASPDPKKRHPNAPPPNFNGTWKQWHRLSDDEKFRYTMASRTYTHGGGAGTYYRNAR